MSTYDPNTKLTRGPKSDLQFPAHQLHPDAADESRKAWYTVPSRGGSRNHAPWHWYERFAWGPINVLISPTYSHPHAALEPRQDEFHTLYGLGCFTHHDLAVMFGVSDDYVKQTLKAARETLQDGGAAAYDRRRLSLDMRRLKRGGAFPLSSGTRPHANGANGHLNLPTPNQNGLLQENT